MKRFLGFILFWIGFGLLLGLIIQSLFIEIVLVLILFLLGYNLFCC